MAKVKLNTQQAQLFDPGSGVPLTTGTVPINTPLPMAWAEGPGEDSINYGVFIAKSAAPVKKEYWWKMMVKELVKVLEDMPGRQCKVLGLILDNVDDFTNCILLTQGQLAKATGASVATVNRVMQILMKHKVLLKLPVGGYQVNPRFMCQRDEKHFNTLMIKFEAAQEQLPFGEPEQVVTLPITTYSDAEAAAIVEDDPQVNDPGDFYSRLPETTRKRREEQAEAQQRIINQHKAGRKGSEDDAEAGARAASAAQPASVDHSLKERR